MTHERLQEISDNADMIVNGYAFTKKDDGFICILNLDHPENAMVVNDKCELIETNMDEIEQQIVLNLCKRNLQIMEAQYA